jgi:hypothetical protein
LKREGYVEGIEVKNKSICTQLQKKVRNYYRDGFLFRCIPLTFVLDNKIYQDLVID